MLVTQKAPNFTATTVLGNNEIVADFNLYENFGEKGTVLFFYPLDFTFVCPSEIIAFDKRLDEFTSRGINVIGVSVDSQFSHFAWKSTAINDGGIGQVRYPLVADLTKQISKDYDVLLDGGVALRGSFLIDADGTVRHAVINDLPLGRNIDEMISNKIIFQIILQNKGYFFLQKRRNFCKTVIIWHYGCKFIGFVIACKTK